MSVSTIPFIPAICVGVEILFFVPSPKFPNVFCPHTYAAPSTVTAELDVCPAEMLPNFKFDSMFSNVDVRTLSPMSFPSCPYKLLPVTNISPFVFNAK